MITFHDLGTIGFLVFLEGILSIDNALVLAMLARGLPPEKQRKALTYGLVGAVIFRLLSLAVVSQLMQWLWVKFVGGGYLIFIALKHFIQGEKSDEDKQAAGAKDFWKVVVMVELTDIAFAVDSILAAVAVSNKFWVVFIGGVLGIIMMRFAASLFLKLLDRFPSFETSAYLLVLTIGLKLVVDGFKIPGVDFHSASSPASWIFWSLMALGLLYGFVPKRKNREARLLEKNMKREARVAEEILDEEDATRTH